jgi:hypothetical protein
MVYGLGISANNDSACLLRLHVDQFSRGMAVRDCLFSSVSMHA